MPAGWSTVPTGRLGWRAPNRPFTLHPSPFTLHPSPFILHSSPFTLHPSPFILHFCRRRDRRPRCNLGVCGDFFSSSCTLVRHRRGSTGVQANSSPGGEQQEPLQPQAPGALALSPNASFLGNAPPRRDPFRQVLLGALVHVVVVAIVGAGAGGAAALFLRGLDVVEHARKLWSWLPWGLPAAALLTAVVVARWGSEAGRGTALLLGRASTGQGDIVPLRLFFFALLGPWWTHLFGGSAGREGAGLQMGATLADQLSVLVCPPRGRWPRIERRRLLAAGLAGGFGGMFGTPWAAALFVLEVLAGRQTSGRRLVRATWRSESGKLTVDLFVVGLAARVGDVVGDGTLRALGGGHATWVVAWPGHLAAAHLLPLFALGGLCGIVAVVFLKLCSWVKSLTARMPPAMAGIVSGLVVVGLWRLAGTDSVLGLSLPSLSAAFDHAAAPSFFAWKLLLTAATVGGGLLGGEVTPLFVVGASLGSAAAEVLGLPMALAAVCGMGAVYGAAARTPLSLGLMAAELCGLSFLLPAWIVVFVAALTTKVLGLRLYEDTSPAPKRGNGNGGIIPMSS
jgi:H+/Cl- antiporter ClcA